MPLNRVDEQIRTLIGEQRRAEAFDQLLAHYQNKVFRLAWSILGNQALAEETAQEVFVRIWRALPRYRGMASLSTWIYTIARNACLTAVKNRVGHRMLSLDEPQVRMAAETRHASPSEQARGPDLRRLVAQLPEKE